MTDTAKDAEQIRNMENYLKEYRFHSHLLRLDRYEREFFKVPADVDELPGERPLARAKMYEIRHFLMSLPNSDDKLLLYYHYIKGEPIERCAELFGVSRSSAFRMKKRALAVAAAHRSSQEETP